MRPYLLTVRRPDSQSGDIGSNPIRVIEKGVLMLTVSSSDVMKLRADTSAPMMDCKQALSDANGDFIAAKSLLRERLGVLDITKLDSGTEGLIAIDIINDGSSASYSIVELATETDFASRSPEVHVLANAIANAILRAKDYEAATENLRASTGENIAVRRADSGRIENDSYWVFKAGSYVHHDGRSGAYVVFAFGVEAESPTDELMRNIAMHVVGSIPRPVCVKTEDVPEVLVENERAFLKTKAEQSGKPPEIQTKIIEGGLSKFRASRSLLEQPYIRDPGKKIKDVLPKGVNIIEFDRWEVGGK
jgi:elongation factor Ts